MTESDTGYVYTLSDPRTEEPKYVGATIEPKQRYRTHLTNPHNDDLAAWVAELAEQDLKPDMNIVQIDEVDGLAEAERRVLNRVANEHEVLNSDLDPHYSQPTASKELGDTAQQALDVLKAGRDDGRPWGRVNPMYLKEVADMKKSTAEYALRQLHTAGWVDRPARGLYELVYDGEELVTRTED